MLNKECHKHDRTIPDTQNEWFSWCLTDRKQALRDLFEITNLRSSEPETLAYNAAVTIHANVSSAPDIGIPCTKHEEKGKARDRVRYESTIFRTRRFARFWEQDRERRHEPLA